MTVFNSLANRFIAASTALALSLVLFSNTLAVPQNDMVAASFVGALA